MHLNLSKLCTKYCWSSFRRIYYRLPNFEFTHANAIAQWRIQGDAGDAAASPSARTKIFWTSIFWALWRNGGSEPDAVWRHRSDWSRHKASSGVWESVHGKGYFCSELRVRRCNQWGLYGIRIHFCSDAALFPNYFGLVITGSGDDAVNDFNKYKMLRNLKRTMTQLYSWRLLLKICSRKSCCLSALRAHIVTVFYSACICCVVWCLIGMIFKNTTQLTEASLAGSCRHLTSEQVGLATPGGC